MAEFGLRLGIETVSTTGGTSPVRENNDPEAVTDKKSYLMLRQQ